jgi:uncharacterized membrane protein YidH (DUF202 family)
MHREGGVPIWFFIGSLLLVYGILILGTGIYHLVNPPESAGDGVALAYLHADIWWSIILIVVGAIYTVKYWPAKGKTRR